MSDERAFDIVGLGLATMDILTVVPHLPGPDDVYAVHDIVLQGGGPAATALVAASRLGATTSYVGVIGAGRWGRATRDEFERYGVDTSQARFSTEGDQSLSVILVDESSGRRSILYRPGNLPALAAEEVPASLIQRARALHLDGVYPAAARRAAEIAREAGVTVSFDGGAGEKWPGIEEILPLVDLLVVARDFAQRYTGYDEPLQAGPALLKAYGPQQVVITDGERGAWFWDEEHYGNRRLHQPAFTVDVVDTTGAGDVFHGAYIYAYLQEWSPRRCLAFASATAALKCRRIGGRAGIPTRDEVEQFVAQALAPDNEEESNDSN